MGAAGNLLPKNPLPKSLIPTMIPPCPGSILRIMIEKGSSDPARRILVLAPNWLGDVIMAAPLLSFLREVSLSSGGPPLEIILGIRRIWAPLFADDPRIDGTMIEDMHTNQIRDAVTLVEQDTFLFSDTIRANIAFSDPTASEEEAVGL